MDGLDTGSSAGDRRLEMSRARLGRPTAAYVKRLAAWKKCCKTR